MKRLVCLTMMLLITQLLLAPDIKAQNVLQLDNGTVRIQLDLNHGGAISYLSLSDSTNNLVNTPDNGRYIQQTYSASTSWSVNQAGIVVGNSSVVLDTSSSNGTLYVKTQPLLSNTDTAQAYIEEWITLDGNVVHVQNKLTIFSNDPSWTVVPHWEESPHAFISNNLKNQYAYSGASPWTNGALTEIPVGGAGWDFYNATEHWCAAVDNNNWGLGIFNDGAVFFSGGNVPQYGFTRLGPLVNALLDTNSTYSYDYDIVLGTLTQIRQYAYTAAGAAPDTALATQWNYSTDMAGWYAGNNVSGTVANDTLTLTISGTNPYILSPYGLNIDASKYKYIQFTMKNNTSDKTAQIEWKTNADVTFSASRTDSVRIAANDGGFTLYTINLSRDTTWTGRIEQLLFNPTKNASSGTVELQQITLLTNVPIKGALTKDNGTVRITLDLNHGGAISYLSLSDSTANLVNTPDNGRYIEQNITAGQSVNRKAEGQSSYYSPWSWNPDQAGDISGNSSVVLDTSTGNGVLYVKTQPLLWDMNADTAQCYMEEWVTLDSSVVHVNNKITMFRTDNIWTQVVPHWEEQPHGFLNAELKNQFSYTDDKPWTNGATTGILSGGIGWDEYNATEHWGAVVTDNNWGVGIYNPGCVLFSGGNVPQYGFTRLGPLDVALLTNNSVYSYNYDIILGTLTQIRQYAYKAGGAVSDTALDSVWNFNTGMAGWYGANNVTSTVANNAVTLTATGSDPYIDSPYGLNVNASRYKYIQFTMKNNTSDTTAKIYWVTNSDLGFNGTNSDSVRINANDGQSTQYTLDLSKNSAWTGRIEQLRVDPIGNASSGTVNLEQIKLSTTITAVNEKNSDLPKTYSLSQNYPNPFNPSTQIKYGLPKEGMVTIKVYNTLGQEVTTLVNQEQKPGYYTLTFEASRFASGVYFYRIQAGSYSLTKKMLLLK